MCFGYVPVWRGTGRAFLMHSPLCWIHSPCPLMSLFGVIPQGLRLPVDGHKVIAFPTLLADRLKNPHFKVERVWPPLVTHWVREGVANIKLEKIKYTLRGLMNKFIKLWKH